MVSKAKTEKGFARIAIKQSTYAKLKELSIAYGMPAATLFSDIVDKLSEGQKIDNVISELPSGRVSQLDIAKKLELIHKDIIEDHALLIALYQYMAERSKDGGYMLDKTIKETETRLKGHDPSPETKKWWAENKDKLVKDNDDDDGAIYLDLDDMIQQIKRENKTQP